MEWKALTHPDDIERNTGIVAEIMQGGLKNYDFEKRYVLRDGKVIWVRVVGSRLDDDHKISIIEDITDRKRTEQALRESEERFRLVVEDAPLGILIQSGGISVSSTLLPLPCSAQRPQTKLSVTPSSSKFIRQTALP